MAGLPQGDRIRHAVLLQGREARQVPAVRRAAWLTRLSVVAIAATGSASARSSRAAAGSCKLSRYHSGTARSVPDRPDNVRALPDRSNERPVDLGQPAPVLTLEAAMRIVAEATKDKSYQQLPLGQDAAAYLRAKR